MRKFEYFCRRKKEPAGNKIVAIRVMDRTISPITFIDSQSVRRSPQKKIRQKWARSFNLNRKKKREKYEQPNDRLSTVADPSHVLPETKLEAFLLESPQLQVKETFLSFFG